MIAAIACGHIARGRIKKNKERLKGIKLANCSLILAYLAFVYIIVMLIVINPAKQKRLLLDLQKQSSSCVSEEDLARILFQPLIPNKGSVGIVIGITRQRNHSIYRYGNPSFDGDTVFEIGSLTKVFTGLALACLVQDGVLSLSDPIKMYLPEDVHPPTMNSKEIQIVHLATYTSGLPRDPPNLSILSTIQLWVLGNGNPYSNFDTKCLYEGINTTKLKTEPGKQPQYSNFGMGVLGHILAKKTKTDYESVIRKRICLPLGMQDTWVRLPEGLLDRLAPPHFKSGQPSVNFEMNSLVGAGGLHSTVNDILVFLDEHISPSNSKLDKAVELALTERFQINNVGAAGLAWVCAKKGNSKIWSHSGGTLGYASCIIMDRESRIGVIVLGNAYFSSLHALDIFGQTKNLSQMTYLFFKELLTSSNIESKRQPVNTADPKSRTAD